jgi:hypothetical protein
MKSVQQAETHKKHLNLFSLGEGKLPGNPSGGLQITRRTVTATAELGKST